MRCLLPGNPEEIAPPAVGKTFLARINVSDAKTRKHNDSKSFSNECSPVSIKMEPSPLENLLKNHSAAHSQDVCRDKGRGKVSGSLCSLSRAESVCSARR